MSFVKKLTERNFSNGDFVFVIQKQDSTEQKVIFTVKESKIISMNNNRLVLVDPCGEEYTIYYYNSTVYQKDSTHLNFSHLNIVVTSLLEVEVVLQEVQTLYMSEYSKVLETSKKGLSELQEHREKFSAMSLPNLFSEQKSAEFSELTDPAVFFTCNFNLSKGYFSFNGILVASPEDDPFSYYNENMDYLFNLIDVTGEQIYYEDHTEYLDGAITLHLESYTFAKAYRLTEEDFLGIENQLNEFFEFLEEQLLANINYIEPILQQYEDFGVYSISNLQYR